VTIRQGKKLLCLATSLSTIGIGLRYGADYYIRGLYITVYVRDGYWMNTYTEHRKQFNSKEEAFVAAWALAGGDYVHDNKTR